MFRVMFLLLSSSSMLKLPIEQVEDAGVIAKFCGKYIVCPAKVGEGICWLQTTTKGQFRLQTGATMIILREGTGARFVTNTFSAG